MQFFDLPNIRYHPAAIGFSPNGRLLATWDRGRVFVLDTFTGTKRISWDKGRLGMSSVPGIGFTADDRAVLSQDDCYPDPFVRVMDLDSGEVVREIQTYHGSAVEPGPGGRLLYLSEYEAQGVIKVTAWDPLTGEKKPSFGQHNGYLRQLAISQDEQWAAGSSTDEIRVWNLSGGKRPSRAARRIKVDTYGCIWGLAISSNGSHVAVNGIGVLIWHVKTGQEWQVARRGGEACREVIFHPNRAILACSGASDEVIFWDAEAGAEIKRYHWDIGRITATAFSPDGNRCAAASKEKLVIWDVDV